MRGAGHDDVRAVLRSTVGPCDYLESLEYVGHLAKDRVTLTRGVPWRSGASIGTNDKVAVRVRDRQATTDRPERPLGMGVSVLLQDRADRTAARRESVWTERWLLTGATGQLGRHLMALIGTNPDRPAVCLATSRHGGALTPDSSSI